MAMPLTSLIRLIISFCINLKLMLKMLMKLFGITTKTKMKCSKTKLIWLDSLLLLLKSTGTRNPRQNKSCLNTILMIPEVWIYRNSHISISLVISKHLLNPSVHTVSKIPKLSLSNSSNILIAIKTA